MKKVRTRFAPSPTGFIHIGNLRTALYAYLVAKKNAGDFLVRIEDTDQSRLVEGALEKILQSLSWANIKIDEGVLLDEEEKIIEKGQFGSYFQSKRLDVYKKYIGKLLDKKIAYPCFCSRERLNDLRKTQQQQKLPPKYDKHCLSLSEEEIQKRIEQGEPHVIRLNVPAEKIIQFKDEVYGKISVKGETIDDQVLIKSDGFPTYHFAVVVDDHLMQISHVVRGEDWLPSAPKHVLLYEAFGWELPVFVHVPNILGENKKKLSKRQGDVSVEDFITKGYLPETIVNFIALLGWNPKTEQEYFSLSELEKVFDVSGLNKAGAVFDYKKLDWMNSHYIKNKKDEELFNLTEKSLRDYCEEKKYHWDKEMVKKIVAIEKNRIKKLSDITEDIDFYFELEKYDSIILNWKENSNAQTKASLEKSLGLMEGLEAGNFSLEKLQEILMEAAGEKKGDFLWPLRVALTGRQKSPSPFEVAWAIGKDESIKRVKQAIASLGEA